jgi:hypothetical protein
MPLPIPQQGKILFPKAQPMTIAFQEFPYGINKNSGAKQLQIGELVDCINFRYDADGRMITRRGLRRVTSTGTGGSDIKYISSGLVDQKGVLFDEHYFDEDGLTFGGTGLTETGFRHVLLVADADHKIYYVDGTSLVYIASNYTAEGDVTMAPFAGYVVIMDGSYIKYWDGNYFKIAYDYGSGTTGYQFDDTGLTNDASWALYNATGHIKYGGSFTTQEWSPGFTIPILSCEVYLSKLSTPTGSLYAKLYEPGWLTISTVCATSYPLDVSTLTTSAVKKTITFDPDDTKEMLPNTTYLLSFEYAGADSSETKLVQVHRDEVTSGYTDYYFDTTWHVAHQAIPLMAVCPGKPPMATFGCAWQNRFWFMDPRNPGWIRFTNANSIFDFSTADGAGYIGSVDDNAKNFPVGAIMKIYGDLYVFGRSEAPYISKITGVALDDVVQSVLLQELPATYMSVVSTINDIWLTNESGVYSVRGVQEYGDIRTNTPGDPIQRIVEDYYDDNAFAAYNPIDGQYFLKLVGYTNVLVGHTRKPLQFGGGIRYPWTEYLFAGITPSAFAFSVDTFYIGATDGHLYALDADVLDYETQPAYTIKSCIIENPFNPVLLNRYYLSLNSDAAASCSLKLYKDGAASALVTKAITIQASRTVGNVLFECRSLQWQLDTFVLTQPINVGSVILQGNSMEARI